MKKFYVIKWNINTDNIEYYDVLPYLCSEIEKKRKKEKINKKDITLEWLKECIISSSQYMYWSRCQYECIISGFPKSKKEYKIDVHQQIMMNIDVIVDLIYKNCYMLI